VLLGWFQSFYGGKGTGTSQTLVSAGAAGGAATSSAATAQYAPTPPWQQAQPSQSKLVQQAMGGAHLFNPSAAKLDMPGASADYKSLFALYSGLNSLYAIAQAATAKGVTSLQQTQLQNAFESGMAQLDTFLGATSFAKIKLTEGVKGSEQTTTASTPAQATSYSTTALNVSGNSSAEVPAFEGNVSFDVNVQLGSGNTSVPIDLNGMGATPRTLSNVITYMNGELKTAGVVGVSFASKALPATADTIQVGNQTVTVSSGQPSWGLTLHTNPAETVTLSAPTTAPAIYVSQVVGSQQTSISGNGSSVAPDAQSQLLKFDTAGNITPAVAPAHGVDGQIFTKALGSAVTSVQSTATSADGSVYVLANIDQTPTGTAPDGGQDVALMKYDSAGHLLFQTDLGSASSASGLSLAVSADGAQVAVAGQVTGSLTAGQTVSDPTGANSFVSVYDSQGNQVWTQQDDGLTPNQANAVAFGANGEVYVTGQSQATATGIGPAAPSNSYLQVFSATGSQVSNTKIATGGTNTSSGIAVDGNNVYVAGVQNGEAVVTEYDMTTPKSPTLVASRDLGSLGGGNVVGIQVQNGTVYVAGSARNGSLNAGAVTSAASGAGLNAFAATLSTGLAPAAGDAIAYYGGSGDTRASGMTVANGEVYLTGSATGDLPGEPAIGANDGFVASLDVANGQVGYAQRFTGLDGKVAPTSIAASQTGASILDQLGLPQGVVDGPVSNLITANTGVKAGDSFQIATNGGPPVTVTIKSTDTFASLATEISQKAGFNVKVSTTFAGVNGATALEIQPASPASTVRLLSGPTGKDALSELGLSPGLVVNTSSHNGVTVVQGSGEPVYGLGIPAALDLSTAADAKKAQVQIAGALQVVETAYQNLKNAATPAPVLALQKAQTSGKTPAYLSSEIANYQAALNRLTAGQSSSSTTGLSSLL
jgi:hypothetical protein